MNIKFLILSFVCVVLSFNAFSQDSSSTIKTVILGYAIQDNDEEDYRFSESTELSDEHSRKEMYYRFSGENEKWHRLGFLGKNLNLIFENNEEAYREFKKYRRRLIWGNITFVGGVILIAPIYLIAKDQGLAIVIGGVYSIFILVPVDISVLFNYSAFKVDFTAALGKFLLNLVLWICASAAPILAIIAATIAMDDLVDLSTNEHSHNEEENSLEEDN